MTLLKIEYTIVSFKKTPQGTFDECVDQWFYARFCPAPRIFTLAPPRRFLPLPLPAPPHRKMLRPAHPWNSTSTVCITLPTCFSSSSSAPSSMSLETSLCSSTFLSRLYLLDFNCQQIIRIATILLTCFISFSFSFSSSPLSSTNVVGHHLVVTNHKAKQCNCRCIGTAWASEILNHTEHHQQQQIELIRRDISDNLLVWFGIIAK